LQVRTWFRLQGSDMMLKSFAEMRYPLLLFLIMDGYIVKNAIKYSLEVPVNLIVTNMFYEIEMKKKAISLINFNDPVFDRFN
jgi:hypothetical protein